MTLRPIRRALLSVSDKTGLIEFASGLVGHGATLISTGEPIVLPRWLTSAAFRLAFTSGVSANQICFERELLDHYRLVFEHAGDRRPDTRWRGPAYPGAPAREGRTSPSAASTLMSASGSPRVAPRLTIATGIRAC